MACRLAPRCDALRSGQKARSRMTGLETRANASHRRFALKPTNVGDDGTIRRIATPNAELAARPTCFHPRLTLNPSDMPGGALERPSGIGQANIYILVRISLTRMGCWRVKVGRYGVKWFARPWFSVWNRPRVRSRYLPENSGTRWTRKIALPSRRAGVGAR